VMTGSVPIFKLHGSLNWSLSKGVFSVYQDVRPVYRHGGTTAIIPPVPEKLTPRWLASVWADAAASLRQANVWVICGYSLPPYDTEVAGLISRSGAGRSLVIFILDPQCDLIRTRLGVVVPHAKIICLPGLPDGTKELAQHLSALRQ